MNPLIPIRSRPGLLVSVRSAAEATVALAGGVDIVDAKEPARGSLGAPDAEVIKAVVKAVGGRVPVSAALGELEERSQESGARSQTLVHSEFCIPQFAIRNPQSTLLLPRGVAFVKMGLAGCRQHADWPARWRTAMATVTGMSKPVAVVYADWRLADAPAPHDVLNEAVAVGCPALLVDTWDKASGTLLDHWPALQLARFVKAVREHGLSIALAGSLSGSSLSAAVRLEPDLVAVRGAVCDSGRAGTVQTWRIRAVRQAIDEARKARSSLVPCK